MERFDNNTNDDDFEPRFERAQITRNGKTREIWVPNEWMLEEHARIRSFLGGVILNIPSAATGSLRNCSPAKNVERHAGNRYFFQLDFKNAYAQVDLESLITIYANLKRFPPPYPQLPPPEDMYELFRDYCFVPGEYNLLHPAATECRVQGVLFGDEIDFDDYDSSASKGLATGAPSSPLLFNMYCIPLDEALLSYTEPRGITYTRYLDDLTFSSSDQNGAIHKNDRRIIRGIIAKHKFALNPTKTRVSDAQKAPIIITGLQLNQFGNWQITERYLRMAYKSLYELVLTRGVDDIDVRELASGYRGLLMSSADKKRAKVPHSEQQLELLVDVIIGRPALDPNDDSTSWYSDDFSDW